MTIDTNTREVDVPVYLVSAPRYLFDAHRDKEDHDLAPLFVRLRDYRAALDEIDRLRDALRIASEVRREALEEAASLAQENWRTWYNGTPVKCDATACAYIAAAIRALIDKETAQ